MPPGRGTQLTVGKILLVRPRSISYIWQVHDILSFFSFLFAVCKDSWEDLTDLVEQMRDDTEGACHTSIFQPFFFSFLSFNFLTTF